MKYYIGIDLGGTNIAVGVVDEQYRIVGRGSLETLADRVPEEIVEDMCRAAEMAAADAKITMDQVEWIGVGSPGTANSDTGVLLYANNLKYFRNVPICDMVEKRLKKKCYIGNDANVAAYGEVLAGAAKDVDTALMITLGTGVGGGVIIDGKIYTGYAFAGAELGHCGMVYNGESCTCGRKGCIEAYCSATALIAQTKAAMLEHRESIMWALTGGDPEHARGKTAFDAMKTGDAVGKQVVDQYIEYLCFAITNYVNIFHPQKVVIGGGISKEGTLLTNPINNYLRENAYNKDHSTLTVAVPAELGNDAGIIGAAFLGNL